jgi:hypothetical protein
MKLTPEQNAHIDKLAQDLLIVEPQDRTPAIMRMVDDFVKAVRAEHPDMPEDKIESAAKRFGDLILQRFNELKNSIAGGEGHA